MHLNAEEKQFCCIKWNEHISEKTFVTKDYCNPWAKNLAIKYTETATAIRGALKYKPTKSNQIEEEEYRKGYTKLPIIFIELYEDESNRLPLLKLDSSKGNHLIIFVHGLQGSSLDLKLFRNVLMMNYKDQRYLFSSRNEQNTHKSLISMGEVLATEVINYIKLNYDSAGPAKLSFIGHSMGGIIIRAALPLLRLYHKKMQIYMSLSSPHTGVGHTKNGIFNTGLWLMNKISNSLSIQQLSMHDAVNPFDTTLYKLSLFEGLSWFQNMILVSSNEDEFASFESARIEVNTSIDILTEYKIY